MLFRQWIILLVLLSPGLRSPINIVLSPEKAEEFFNSPIHSSNEALKDSQYLQYPLLMTN